MRTTRYVNGNIYTMDERLPRAQAMAIDQDSGRILVMGTNDEVQRSGGRDSTVVDLRGLTVLPGLIDAHIHLLMTAQQNRSINASTCTDEDAVAALVGIRAAQTPRGTWITGNAWDRNRWPSATFPTRASLDSVAPFHPVALWSKDGHVLWANSLALTHAGVTAETPDPPGGTIIRDSSDQPSGVLLEGGAIHLVSQHIPSPDRAQNLNALATLMKDLLRHGITSVHAIEESTTPDLLLQLRQQKKPCVRACIFHLQSALAHIQKPSWLDEDFFLRIGGIKLFADGTLGSQTAAMLEPYEQSSDNRGILTISSQEMHDAIETATAKGLMVAIHTIGDRSAQLALDTIKQVHHKFADKTTQLRYRLEHAQLIKTADLQLMRKLGVIASIQPFHAVADRDIAERYWGQRARQAYLYHNMHMMGIPLAIGSDAPIETYDPFQILAAATARHDPATPERSPWQPEQALSVLTALQSYTVGAAYAGAEQEEKGQLCPGKLGDAIVLREDILATPPARIHENEVLATIQGGEIVYGNV